MYEVRNAAWIRDDIESCKKRIDEIRDQDHNYGEMCKLLNSLSDGVNLLHEGDILASLSKEEKAEYQEYLSSMTQYILNAKMCIRM